MYGNAEKKYHGLINHPLVATAPADTGDWANAEVDQILADFNAGLAGITGDTNYMAMANTVLLPHATLELLATRRLGDNETTVLMFLEKHNIYTARTGQKLDIKTVRGLDKAGAGETARMVAYRKVPEVLKMHMPMPYRFLPMREKGVLNYVVPGVFRTGGLDIRLPKEVRYIDGI